MSADVGMALNLRTGGREISQDLDRLFSEVRNRRPGLAPAKSSGEVSLAQGLFESAAHLKVTLNQVSMHLGKEWRDRIFRQLDSLLDIDEWDPRDPPPGQGSAQTFIRLLLFVSPDRKPGLAASNTGTLVATWIQDGGRLTIECIAGDRLRWVLSRQLDNQTERAAGDTTLTRLKKVLAPYSPEVWFSNAK